MSANNFRKHLDLNLRQLILLLAIFSVSSLFIISLIISYQIVKNQLIDNSLALNADHAHKIALSTDNHFRNMLLELDYSAKILGQDFNNNELREAEVNKLKYQSEHYNSVVISDTCILIDIVISYHYTQIVEFGVLLKS